MQYGKPNFIVTLVINASVIWESKRHVARRRFRLRLKVHINRSSFTFEGAIFIMSDTLSPQAAALVNWSKDVTIKEYSGSCHCKKIQFKFEHPVFDDGSMGVTHCNCSICHAKGLILT